MKSCFRRRSGWIKIGVLFAVGACAAEDQAQPNASTSTMDIAVRSVRDRELAGRGAAGGAGKASSSVATDSSGSRAAPPSGVAGANSFAETGGAPAQATGGAGAGAAGAGAASIAGAATTGGVAGAAGAGAGGAAAQAGAGGVAPLPTAGSAAAGQAAAPPTEPCGALLACCMTLAARDRDECGRALQALNPVVCERAQEAFCRTTSPTTPPATGGACSTLSACCSQVRDLRDREECAMFAARANDAECVRLADVLCDL